MKQKTRITVICILTIITVLGTSVVWGQPMQEGKTTATMTEEPSLPAPARVKAVKASATALKLKWSKVEGAIGYTIYRCKPKGKAFKKIKTVGKNKTTWVNKKLKSDKIYKYKIRAFTKANGQQQDSAYSYVVSGVTNTKKAKKVNAKKIKVDYSARHLGLHSVSKITPTLVVSKGKTAISSKVRWKSSDTSIVSVTKSGWLQGKGKVGSAKVDMIAHNGITKTLTVHVDDYANPAMFGNLDEVKKWSKKAAKFLTTYKNDICAVATYLEQYKTTHEFYYADGDIQIDGYIEVDAIEAQLTKLFREAGARYIYLSSGQLYFKLAGEGMILYGDYNGADSPKYGTLKIAPCWIYFGGRNAE